MWRCAGDIEGDITFSLPTLAFTTCVALPRSFSRGTTPHDQRGWIADSEGAPAAAAPRRPCTPNISTRILNFASPAAWGTGRYRSLKCAIVRCLSRIADAGRNGRSRLSSAHHADRPHSPISNSRPRSFDCAHR